MQNNQLQPGPATNHHFFYAKCISEFFWIPAVEYLGIACCVAIPLTTRFHGIFFGHNIAAAVYETFIALMQCLHTVLQLAAAKSTIDFVPKSIAGGGGCGYWQSAVAMPE